MAVFQRRILPIFFVSCRIVKVLIISQLSTSFDLTKWQCGVQLSTSFNLINLQHGVQLSTSLLVQYIVFNSSRSRVLDFLWKTRFLHFVVLYCGCGKVVEKWGRVFDTMLKSLGWARQQGEMN